MRTALITGAGSGIGRATALRLAKSGHAIALVGRSANPLDQVAAEIESAGGKAFPIPADVTQLDQVESAIHRTAEAFGGVDVLVNSAGVAPVVPLAQLTAQQWHEVLNSNLSSAFYTTRTVWPLMTRQHKSPSSHSAEFDTPSSATGGVIINISSMASKDPFPGLGAYAAAKAALNMLTLVTAREGHDVGIRAICIAPAAVDTPMFRQVVGNKPVSQDMVLDPADVADMIAQAIIGSLRYCSGDTLFIHKRPT